MANVINSDVPTVANSAQTRAHIINSDVPTVANPAAAVAATGVRKAPAAQQVDASNPNDAPAKAPAANKGNTQSVYTGLCEGLNAWQRDLVTKGTYQFPDIYEVQFAPKEMGSASLKKQGSVDKKYTPTVQAKDPKSQLDPETNKVDTAASIIQISAGTQIVQFLEQYIRNSTYITDQQLYIVDPNTQKIIPSGKSPTGQVAWFKINVSVVPYGTKIDEKRNDFPYKITYIITPYAINELQSQWFPQSSFRGLHKSYNYWFTGQNTEIIGFDQDINALWHIALSGALPTQQKIATDSRILTKYTWQTGSDASTQGPASGKVNEPGANAANLLYDAADQTRVKLQIVGDPAWLPQGEAGPGIKASQFTFSPFLTDGTINFDCGEVLFDLSFNQPADYNFQTGLMEVTQHNVPADVGGAGTLTLPQENYTYRALNFRSTFARGKFTQELEGSIYTGADAKINTSANGRETLPTLDQLGYRDSNLTAEQILNPNNWDSEPDNKSNPTSQTADQPASDSGANLSPSKPPLPPTSNGDLTQIPIIDTDTGQRLNAPLTAAEARAVAGMEIFTIDSTQLSASRDA